MSLGVGFCARGTLWQQRPEPRAGHGWGMRAEEPCQGSLHWNIQPQCPLEANSQPAAAWEEPGQTSHGAGGGDGALGAPIARGFCGVGDGDVEPGVSSAPSCLLCVCLAASKAGKASRDLGNNSEYVKVIKDLGCLGVM